MANDKKHKYSGSKIILLQDTGLSVLASFFAIILTRWITEPFMGFSQTAFIWSIAGGAASFISMLIFGSHKVIRRFTTVYSLVSIFLVVLLKEILLLSVLVIDSSFLPDVTSYIILFLSDLLFSASLLILIRVLIMVNLKSAQNNPEVGIGRMNVLIVGTDNVAVELAEKIDKFKNTDILGYLTVDKDYAGKILYDKKIYYCSGREDIVRIEWSVGGIDGVAFNSSELNRYSDLYNICIEQNIPVMIFPNKSSGSRTKITDEADASNKIIVPDGMSKFESIIKRGLDFILSGFLLLFFSPLFLICFIALKIGDKGPAVYRQERIGLNGKPFNILKFRSMRIDAEAFGPALYSGDDDPRLTKIGKFLRLHHLDELPQLWNVFRGDMSFIGYRPERQFYIDQIMEIDSRYRFLYQIRPGVTSYATLYNGYTDTLDKMIRRMEYDLFYLRNRSLLFDAKILWMTFAGIVFGKKF